MTGVQTCALPIFSCDTEGREVVVNTTAKIKKSEFSKLKEVCEKAEISPDVYVICSKNGFSSELKSLKGDTLKLFSLKHLKYLVENIGEKELIPCAGKKY